MKTNQKREFLEECIVVLLRKPEDVDNDLFSVLGHDVLKLFLRSHDRGRAVTSVVAVGHEDDEHLLLLVGAERFLKMIQDKLR